MTRATLCKAGIGVVLVLALWGAFVTVRGVIAGKPWWHFHARPLGIEGYVVRVGAGGEVLGPGTSVAAGDRIGFAVSSDTATTWRPSIEDAVGRKIADMPAVTVNPHPSANPEPWRQGSDFPVALTWRVPADLASGLYTVAGDPQLFFVVRRPHAATAPILVLLPTDTVNAYSITAGRSLYPHPTQVTTASFLRPQDGNRVALWPPFIRWLTAQKPFAADVTFAADPDMADPAVLDGVKVLIVLGHAEYWTRAARLNFDAFVARGGDAILAGGNDMWWQSRRSPDGLTLSVFRDLADKPVAQGGDPETDPHLKTKQWIAPALAYPVIPSTGGDFEHGGFGQRGAQNGQFKSEMTVAEPGSPLLAGTGLELCDRFELPRSTEYDGAPILGLDARGLPVPDLKAIGGDRFALIAYIWNRNRRLQMGTVHLLQRTPQSGVVLHMGGRECCMTGAFYADATHGMPVVQAILANAVRLFLTGGDPFAGAAPERQVAYPLTTPWTGPVPAVPENACAPHLAAAGTASEGD